MRRRGRGFWRGLRVGDGGGSDVCHATDLGVAIWRHNPVPPMTRAANKRKRTGRQ
jgi:hypothetical protein